MRTAAQYSKHLSLSRFFARFFARFRHSEMRNVSSLVQLSVCYPWLALFNAQLLASTSNVGSDTNISIQPGFLFIKIMNRCPEYALSLSNVFAKILKIVDTTQ